MALLCKGFLLGIKEAALIKINCYKPVVYENGRFENQVYTVKAAVNKVLKIISKNKECDKDLVTVKGTMDVNELVPYLKEKLKRNVEAAPAKKDEGENKESDKGREMTQKEAEPGGAKVEVNKMEYNGYAYQPGPIYWYGGHGYSVVNRQIGYMMDHHHNLNLHAPDMFSDENRYSFSAT